MWKTISYEARGKSHIKSGVVCQDKTYKLCDGEYSSVALADGAGSAKFSQFGAEVACKTICEYVNQYFEELYIIDDALVVKRRIIDAILENLKVETIKNNCRIEELSSTLLFASIKNGRVIAFHLGDGAIGYIKGNELKLLSKPNNGEFANATYFVTTKHAAEQSKIIRGNATGIKGFILLSDGSTNSFYDKQNQKMTSGAKRLIEWTRFMYEDKMLAVVKDVFESKIVNKTTDDCSIAMLATNEVLDEDFNALDKREKCLLFDRAPQTAVRFLDERYKILKFLTEPKEIGEIMSFTKIDDKQQLMYRLKHLINLGMVKLENGLYKSDII